MFYEYAYAKADELETDATRFVQQNWHRLE